MYNDIRKNENKGFSLVELIVVIAIMAVMTAVLAPALLQYVEKSRAQKDDSAMGEVVEVIKLALSEQEVYDELLCYTASVNNSHYTDTADEVRAELCECAPDATDPCSRAKAFRGVTITFVNTHGSNEQIFDLGAGVINEDLPSGATLFNGDQAAATLASMTSGNGKHELYTRVKAGIEDGKVKLTSQTYRNSDYTVFIQMGAADEAVVVYGQWDGTNLHTA